MSELGIVLKRKGDGPPRWTGRISYKFGGWDSRFGDMIGTKQTGWPIAVYPPEPRDTRFLYAAVSQLPAAWTGVHRVAARSRNLIPTGNECLPLWSRRTPLALRRRTGFRTDSPLRRMPTVALKQLRGPVPHCVVSRLHGAGIQGPLGEAGCMAGLSIEYASPPPSRSGE